MQSTQLVFLGLNSFTGKDNKMYYQVCFAYPCPKPGYESFYQASTSFVSQELFTKFIDKKVKQFSFFSGSFSQNTFVRVDAQGKQTTTYSYRLESLD